MSESRWWSVGSFFASLAWASAVTLALQPLLPEPKDPPPPKLRVVVKPAAPALAAAAPVEKVEKLQTKEPERLKDKQVVKTADVAKETPRYLESEVVIEATATLPPQPALTQPRLDAMPSLPRIGEEPPTETVATSEPETANADELPQSPANMVSTSYPNVEPFGNSAVFALLVDSEGVVVDVRIVIPSISTLTDISYSLALRGANYKMDPPLAPGELRWFETKFDYRPKQEPILP